MKDTNEDPAKDVVKDATKEDAATDVEEVEEVEDAIPDVQVENMEATTPKRPTQQKVANKLVVAPDVIGKHKQLVSISMTFCLFPPGEAGPSKRPAPEDIESCKCSAKCATKGLCSCKRGGNFCHEGCHPKNKKCTNKDD